MVGATKFESEAAQSARASRRTPSRAWAGWGTGARCDLCQRVIHEDQVEYEVETSEARNRILTLHLDCYEQWMASRDGFGASGDRAPNEGL